METTLNLIEELDIKVIDSDTHIVEAYDLWTTRVSGSTLDAPHGAQTGELLELKIAGVIA